MPPPFKASELLLNNNASLEFEEEFLEKLDDIPNLLHFNMSEGIIWHEDRRMVMMNTDAIGALRQELIESYGLDAARSLMTRFGYTAGCNDAELALKMYKEHSTLDLLTSGIVFHALRGMVAVEIINVEINAEEGICNIAFNWINSFEDHLHTQAYGIGGDAACWVDTGYASGFLSTCMGKRILVKEVECRAQGYDVCRCLAKPVEEWEDAGEELKYFNPIAPLLQQQHQNVSDDHSDPEASPSPPFQKDAHWSKNIIGASVPFNILMHKIKRVAPTNATVLLLGESGVGKSALAREIYRQSSRQEAPFLEVNCAAIPEQLIESELFGVEKGAYTGASASRKGRFQSADGGILFLDEIGTLSMTAQGKLLRAIQTGEFEPLGSNETLKVNVRIIAATNEDLMGLVKNGEFREDLFYRLNVFPIVIPPLRKRRDDIPVLLEHLMKKYSHYHDKEISGISSQALQIILNHSWPGNIRELENVIERGIILADDHKPLSKRHLFTIDGSIREDSLMSLNEMGVLKDQQSNYDLKERSEENIIENESLKIWSEGVVERQNITLNEVENALFIAAYNNCKGNYSKAAERLGITRAQFSYKAKKMGID